MSKITKSQIVKLHALLNNAGLMEHKKEIVLNYSNNRTQSSKELTSPEAKSLIDDLQNRVYENDSKTKMIKKIFAICRAMGWIEGNSLEDKKMNNAKVKAFILKKGYLFKSLDQYTETELPKLVSQFESIQKNIEKTKVNKGVRDLLIELNITNQ